MTIPPSFRKACPPYSPRCSLNPSGRFTRPAYQVRYNEKDFSRYSVKSAWTGKSVKKSIPSGLNLGWYFENHHARAVSQGQGSPGHTEENWLWHRGLRKSSRRFGARRTAHSSPETFHKHWCQTAKGVLMHGLQAQEDVDCRGIANEVDCTLKPINGPEIIMTKASPKNTQAFRRVAEEALCIIFIDEIDTGSPPIRFRTNRGSGHPAN